MHRYDGDCAHGPFLQQKKEKGGTKAKRAGGKAGSKAGKARSKAGGQGTEKSRKRARAAEGKRGEHMRPIAG